MTFWKCPDCAWTKETKDDIVFVACSCCLTEMKRFPIPKQLKIEVKHDNKKRSKILI